MFVIVLIVLIVLIVEYGVAIFHDRLYVLFSTIAVVQQQHTCCRYSRAAAGTWYEVRYRDRLSNWGEPFFTDSRENVKSKE